MSKFARYDVIVVPRKLTDLERKEWKRLDGSERECVVVYNYHLGREIPSSGEKVAITSSEFMRTYSKMERDGDVTIRMPAEVSPVTFKPEPKPEPAQEVTTAPETSDSTFRRSRRKSED